MQRIEGPPYPSWEDPDRKRFSREVLIGCLAGLAVCTVVAVVCAVVNQLTTH